MAYVPTELALRPRRLIGSPSPTPLTTPGSGEPPAGLGADEAAEPEAPADEPSSGPPAPRQPAEAGPGPSRRSSLSPPGPVEVVVMLDERDRIAWANPAVLALVGRSPEELLGTPGLELVHPEDRDILARSLEEMRGSPLALTMTLRVLSATGEAVPAEVVATNLIDEPGLKTVSLTLRRLERGKPVRRRGRRPHHPQTVLDSLQEGVVVLMGDGTVLSCNAAAPRLLGVSRAELIGRSLPEVIAAATAGAGEHGAVLDENGAPVDPRSDHAILEVAPSSTGGTVRGHRRGETTTTWLRFDTAYVGGGPSPDDSEAEQLLLSISDITALRQADEDRRAALAALAEEREFLGALVGNLDAGVVACDARGRLTVTNATFRLFGDYRPEEVTLGSEPPVQGMYWPDGTPLKAEEHPLRQALAGVRVSDLEIVLRPGESSPPRFVSTSATVLRSEDGRLLGAVAGFQDVTDVKETARELTELALHDPLTGCANRLLLADRVALAAEFAKRERLYVGLLVIDLDDFKQVNDNFGHLVGDEVLIGVGRRLRSVVRPGDTVARYGGDEFVVLCQVAGGADELDAVKERIIARLREPFRIGAMTLPVGASVGSALLPGSEADLNRLVRTADAEMYEHKLARRS